MRAGFLLVFLLSAAFVSQSEGGWLKDAVRKVGKWLKDNCTGSVGQGGASVTCGKGRKRDLDGDSRATLDRACQLIEGDHYVWEEGISSELVADIFEEVDGINDPADKDGILDDAEYAAFMESMEVFDYCLSR